MIEQINEKIRQVPVKRDEKEGDSVSEWQTPDCIAGLAQLNFFYSINWRKTSE